MSTANSTYSLEDIRKAFWATFHKSGGLFFQYKGSDRDCMASTEHTWLDFEDQLITAGLPKKRPTPKTSKTGSRGLG